MKGSLFIFFLLFCTCLSAEDKSIVSAGANAFMYGIKSLNVKVIDEVIDGCLPNPKGVETAAKSALVRNGFDIVENPYFGNYFVVFLFGYSLSGTGGCVVMLNIDYVDTISAIIPHAHKNTDVQHTLVELVIDIHGTMLTGPKHQMQQRAQNEAANAADELLLMTIRAKKNLEKDFPQLLSTMEKNKQQQTDK